MRMVRCAAALMSLLLVKTAAAESGTELSLTNLFPGGAGDPIITISCREQPGGEIRQARVSQITLTNGILRAEEKGYRVDFSVLAREAYHVLRITGVEEPSPGSLMRFEFRLAARSPCILTRLDYMTVPVYGDKGMSWPWIWARGASNPAGGFALHTPKNDREHDENLLRMWVEEGLPHPDVGGAWDVDRARAWLAAWQERFSDQSCLVIGATNRMELDRMTDWAASIGMKRIYLHTDTWRGEYWPVQYSYLRVNPAVFPRGEEDLNEYTSALREKGMSFAVHSTSISIARNDPDYVRNGLHPDLARWVRGTLEKDAVAGDGVLYFRPAPGSRYPDLIGHTWRGPGTLPSFMNLRLFRVGDELVDVGLVENTDQDVWVLKHCRRGDWGTKPSAHPAGTVTDGMMRGYGQAFMPDSDSPLFEETISRWADFCARNNVDHLECDAVEIHDDHPWGREKFSWLLSSKLKTPSTSNTSNGRPLPFQVEYWFRSSAKVMANHAQAGAAGGASLPLYLHSDIRTATGPYEILQKPQEMIGHGGNSFNISYPWPMFGVTPAILDGHGMVPVVEDLLASWRSALKVITPEQRAVMNRTRIAFRGITGPINQSATDVLFRPELDGDKVRVTPLRLAGRVSGELNWGYGQEFGPVVPRLHMMAGRSVQLVNPLGEQEPEFVLRVMGRTAELTGENPGPVGVSQPQESILDAYAAGTTTKQEVHPLHAAQHIWAAAAMAGGSAKPGRVSLRREIIIPNTSAVSRARFFIQVDDEAVVRWNGKKVFGGGHYNRLFFVDLPAFRSGTNEVVVEALNVGGSGALAAAVFFQQDEGEQWINTDASWSGKVDGGPWEPVAVLANYGAGPWAVANPESGAPRKSLMPGSARIDQKPGQELSHAEGVLQIVSNNEGDKTAVHFERPSWGTSVDMREGTGLACTVEGDGSGAVLVVTLYGRGLRDYVIPIDFVGEREVVVPTGEVAWSDPRWGWRFESARFDYSRITRVSAGLGSVPSRTATKISVSNLRPVTLEPAMLEDLRIRVAGDRELVVPGEIASGHYLWYRGGDAVGLYDLNWNKVEDRPVLRKDFRLPQGEFALTVDSDATPGQEPWLEMQYLVKDQPLLEGRMTDGVGTGP